MDRTSDIMMTVRAFCDRDEIHLAIRSSFNDPTGTNLRPGDGFGKLRLPEVCCFLQPQPNHPDGLHELFNTAQAQSQWLPLR